MSPWVYGLFYKATVQAVLLFWGESWSLLPASMRILEGFNIRAARRITVIVMLPEKHPDDFWLYPDSTEVLEAACLHTIREYIEMRRNRILKFISQHPIYTLCTEAGRQWGTNFISFGGSSRWSERS